MARRIDKISDLTPDKRNANKGTVRGLAMLFNWTLDVLVSLIRFNFGHSRLRTVVHLCNFPLRYFTVHSKFPNFDNLFVGQHSVFSTVSSSQHFTMFRIKQFQFPFAQVIAMFIGKRHADSSATLVSAGFGRKFTAFEYLTSFSNSFRAWRISRHTFSTNSVIGEVDTLLVQAFDPVAFSILPVRFVALVNDAHDRLNPFLFKFIYPALCMGITCVASIGVSIIAFTRRNGFAKIADFIRCWINEHININSTHNYTSLLPLIIAQSEVYSQ